jgi:hypothetical protein
MDCCASLFEKLAFKTKKASPYLLPEFESFPKADVKIRFSKISVPTTAEGEKEWEPKSSQ